VASAPFRYLSHEEDSARWLGFPFRPGDIVVSSRRRTGTTWMQMICALLIHQTPEPPAPLWHLSPWLDHMVVPRDFLYARLAEQPHRRFIKTHTPLDGLPLDPRVSYIVTARHPLDMFVSLQHHLTNIDQERVGQLTGRTTSADPSGPRESLHDSLLRWIDDDSDPRAYPDSLPGVMWHLSDAWARRGQPNVLLVRYEDLCADLEGQMRHIALWLGIAVPERAWPRLTKAATFQFMRDHADRLVPSTQGFFKDPASFFRRGTSGAGREILSDEEMAGYYARAAELAPPDMLEWLHSPPSPTC
jgi:aryl sulfotransferase